MAEAVGANGELLGSGGKVYINGYSFDCKEGSLDEDRNTARGDTTATGRFQINVIDKQVLQFSVQAIRKSTFNPHSAGLYIAQTTAGGVYDQAAVIYYPNGNDVGTATKSWRFTIVWTKYSERFNADNGLLMLTANGISTGSYQRPGDA
jgi:hypothetical protein